MKTLVIVVSMLALSNLALAAKGGAEPSVNKVVGVTDNYTNYYANFLETTRLCKERFGDNAAVANTAEFIEGIGNGLDIIENTDAIRVVMRTSGIVNSANSTYADTFYDIYTQTKTNSGYVVFLQAPQGTFSSFPTASTSFNYRVACVYYQ